MAQDNFLDEYNLEDGEWEEGVVYIDEDGNEFTVEFVYEDADEVGTKTNDSEADPDDARAAEAGNASAKPDKSNAQASDRVDESSDDDSEENPFAYNAVQSATDTANAVYREGAGTVREIAQAGHEMKEAVNDIKSMFDLKDLFKF